MRAHADILGALLGAILLIAVTVVLAAQQHRAERDCATACGGAPGLRVETLRGAECRCRPQWQARGGQ